MRITLFLAFQKVGKKDRVAHKFCAGIFRQPVFARGMRSSPITQESMGI